MFFLLSTALALGAGAYALFWGAGLWETSPRRTPPPRAVRPGAHRAAPPPPRPAPRAGTALALGAGAYALFWGAGLWETAAALLPFLLLSLGVGV